MKTIVETLGVVPTLITAAAVIAIIVVIVLILVSKGILKVRVKGISLEAPSRDNIPSRKEMHEMVDRTFLFREVNYLEDFIRDAKVRIGLMLSERQLAYSADLVSRVCDKLHNRMLTWVILNHIADTPEYTQAKTDEAFRAVIGILHRSVPELLQDPVRYKALRDIVSTLVAEFIPELVKIKDSSGISKA